MTYVLWPPGCSLPQGVKKITVNTPRDTNFSRVSKNSVPVSATDTARPESSAVDAAANDVQRPAEGREAPLRRNPRRPEVRHEEEARAPCVGPHLLSGCVPLGGSQGGHTSAAEWEAMGGGEPRRPCNFQSHTHHTEE